MQTNTFNQQVARIAVGGYEDVQQFRKAMMNRVRDLVRKKNEGIPFDRPEEEKDSEEKDYESKYKDKNLADLIEQMLEEGKLDSREYEYLVNMIEAAKVAEDIEEIYKNSMKITEQEPIYQEWLTDVYGVSTTLTAKLIHMYGYCEDFSRVSKMWAYSGLAPGQKRKRGEKLEYNPDAKTLGWLIADRMIMQGSRSMYKQEFFDPYKEKQVKRMELDSEGLCIVCGQEDQMSTTEAMMDAVIEDPKEDIPSVCMTCYNHKRDEGEHLPTPPQSQGHANNRAIRYLAKKFLKHYWAISRHTKGLETPDEWVLTHGGHEKETETFENPFYAKRQIKGNQ